MIDGRPCACPTGCDAGWRGWLVARRVHSPPFSRRGGCAINKKTPFLSGADGVVSKFQQKIRCATRIFIRRLRDLLLTTPSAPLRNGTFLLRRSHPSLKTEGNALASTAAPIPLRAIELHPVRCSRGCPARDLLVFHERLHESFKEREKDVYCISSQECDGERRNRSARIDGEVAEEADNRTGDTCDQKPMKIGMRRLECPIAHFLFESTDEKHAGT